MMIVDGIERGPVCGGGTVGLCVRLRCVFEVEKNYQQLVGCESVKGPLRHIPSDTCMIEHSNAIDYDRGDLCFAMRHFCCTFIH